MLLSLNHPELFTPALKTLQVITPSPSAVLSNSGVFVNAPCVAFTCKRQGVFRPVLRCLVCYRAFVRRPLCKRNHRRIGFAHRIVGGRQRHFVAREEICRTICIRHARSRQRAVVDADLVRLSEAVGRKAVGFVRGLVKLQDLSARKDCRIAHSFSIGSSYCRPCSAEMRKVRPSLVCRNYNCLHCQPLSRRCLSYPPYSAVRQNRQKYLLPNNDYSLRCWYFLR